jgi:hypothetical protein
MVLKRMGATLSAVAASEIVTELQDRTASSAGQRKIHAAAVAITGTEPRVITASGNDARASQQAPESLPGLPAGRLMAIRANSHRRGSREAVSAPDSWMPESRHRETETQRYWRCKWTRHENRVRVATAD